MLREQSARAPGQMSMFAFVEKLDSDLELDTEDEMDGAGDGVVDDDQYIPYKYDPIAAVEHLAKNEAKIVLY